MTSCPHALARGRVGVCAPCGLGLRWQARRWARETGRRAALVVLGFAAFAVFSLLLAYVGAALAVHGVRP